MKAVLANRIYISKTDELEKKLIQELTYQFPGAGPKSRPILVCNMTTVNNNILSIPIGRVDLIPKNYTIIDKRTYNPCNFPKLKQILRESQQKIYDIIDDNWVINAKPGWGKTFTALAIASKLKQKTVVVVQTVKLRDQWSIECEKMFGFKPGIIGSGKLITDPNIVIANSQTLINNTAELSSMFGTTIVDEVHRLPSETFKTIIDKSRSRYKIGLSGTLGRKDQKHALIPDYISKNTYIPPKENVVDPIILIYPSKFKIPGNHMIPWATRINELAYNPEYQKEVVGIVNAQVNRGHKVLVVSDRIEFLENCSNMTENSVCIISKTKNQASLEQEIKTGSKTSIYGSISIFKEGISINELSCLILATAVNNEYLLEQLVGRIMRICNGALNPEVVDIKFKGRTGENQFKTRQSFYIQEGFKIIEIPLELIK